MSKHPIAEQQVVLKLPGMDDVPVSRDVQFAAGVSANLRMDVYRPAEITETRLPAVVLVTGSCRAAGEVHRPVGSNWIPRIVQNQGGWRSVKEIGISTGKGHGIDREGARMPRRSVGGRGGRWGE